MRQRIYIAQDSLEEMGKEEVVACCKVFWNFLEGLMETKEMLSLCSRDRVQD